jgi:hypothetical protein
MNDLFSQQDAAIDRLDLRGYAVKPVFKAGQLGFCRAMLRRLSIVELRDGVLTDDVQPSEIVLKVA